MYIYFKYTLNEPPREDLCRQMMGGKKHFIHVHDIHIRVNAQRPNLSHLMQKILSDKTNADGGFFTTQRSFRVSAARREVSVG